MKRRILSVFVVFCMVLTLLPMETLAKASDFISVTLDDMSGVENENLVTEESIQTIMSWFWIDSDENLTNGSLFLPDVDTANQQDFQTVASMLPTGISAEIKGKAVPQKIALSGWTCERYVQDENGIWPVNGLYIFTSSLPEGYSLGGNASALMVKVRIGSSALIGGMQTSIGDFYVTTAGLENTDYSYDAQTRTLTVKTSTPITIANQTPNAPTTDKVVVDGACTGQNSADITLSGVNIDLSDLDGRCAFEIRGDAVCNLTLAGDNTLKSGQGMAGLQVQDKDGMSATIIITDEEQNSGSLSVTDGQGGAGIGGGVGGGVSGAGGTITIMGGTINATGSDGAGIGGAGINGGVDFNGEVDINGGGGTITIMGGTINATGSNGAGIGAAGIGGGATITIMGGTVNATGSNGAGIGGSGRAGVTITIMGGTINATGSNGAGIGSRIAGGATITIMGGTINATGSDGAGIGGGYMAQSDAINYSNITIGGGDVTAIGSSLGAGIGSSGYGSVGNIIIEGGTVTVTGGKGGAGIGSAYAGGGNIIIKGGAVTATGGEGKEGIGGETITIEGGTLAATGGKNKAGVIGGSITIEGGTLAATGGKGGEGISGSYGLSPNIIIIKGGAVTATGGEEKAGIGGGTIVIEGGIVTAVGGENGSGIGGGFNATNNGTLSSGENGGDAWVVTNSVTADTTGFTDGVIFDEKIGTVYGSASLVEDVQVSSDSILTIASGNTLTIANGTTLINYGTINIVGTLINHGTIINYGTITGLIAGNGAVNNVSKDPPKKSSNTAEDAIITITSPSPAKPNGPTQAAIKINSKTDDKDNEVVTVTSKNITDAVTKAKEEAEKKSNTENGIAIVIHSDISGRISGNVIVNLLKGAQDVIISEKIVKITVVVGNNDIQIGMDLKAITEINKQAQSRVTISAARVDNESLSENVKDAIGSRSIFDVNITYGVGKAIKNFGTSRISVSLPYSLGKNENAGNVRAVYVDDNENVQSIIDSFYDNANEAMCFYTNSCSIYGVGYWPEITYLTDIDGHWAKDDILFMVNRGLMSGMSDTSFNPNTAMTRGMFVTALGRLARADLNGYEQSSFSDVMGDAYYMRYIEWANVNDIVDGHDGKFMPKQAITREQMAVIICNYAKAIEFSIPIVHAEDNFADDSEISDYAEDSVKAMQMAGVLGGREADVFDPKMTATRAEVCVVLRRFLELCISTDMAIS